MLVMKHKNVFLMIFIVALIVRVVFFIVSFAHNNYQLDSTIRGNDGYYEISQNLLHSNGYSSDTVPPYRPNSIRLPLLIFVVTFSFIIFGSYWSAIVLLILLGSVIPILGIHIADKLFNKRAISIGVGVLLALEPFGVFVSTVFYTETLFTFLFLLFFIFLIHYFENKSLANLIWMTIFLSLATLVKPTSQYLPIFIIGLILYEGRGHLTKRLFRDIAFVGIISILLLLPWMYRNHIQFNSWSLSAQPAFNTYFYLVPTVLAIDNHTDYASEYLSFTQEHNIKQADITLSNADYYTQESINIISNHKIALLKSTAMTIITFFTHDGMLTVLGATGITLSNTLGKPALSLLFENPRQLFGQIATYANSPGIIIFLMRFFWIFMTLCFFAGVFFYIKKNKISIPIFTTLFLVLYFALTTTINGFGVNARFRLPINIFIFVFALYGILCLNSFTMKKIIKTLLIYLLYYSGLNWLVSKFLNKKVFCVGYHSIFSEKRKFRQELYSNISISVHDFEKQILFLKNHGHTFIHFSDLKNPKTKKLNKPTIIFFDDGFKDVLVNALPILKKYNIPATIFVTTGLIDHTHFMWTLGLRYFLFKNGLDENLIENKIKEFKKLPIKELEKSLKIIYDRNNFVLNPNDFNIFLNWDDIKNLSQNSFEIGSHGITHQKFTELNNKNIHKELAYSKKILEEKIGKKIKILSYPYGWYDDMVENIAIINDYFFGISTESGINNFEEINNFPFRLKKIGPEPNDSLLNFKVRLYNNFY